MTICFFEDEGDRLLAPLTLTRPVDDLRIGILRIREKWQRHLDVGSPADITRIGRPPLDRLFRSDPPDGDVDVLWINARWLPDFEAAELLGGLDGPCMIRREGVVVAARLGPDESRKCHARGIRDLADSEETRELPVIETTAGRLVSYLWDLFLKNGAEIRMDVSLLAKTGGLASNGDSLPDFPGAVLGRREQIHAEEGVRVDPGVIIDASDGPVYLGAESHIMSGAIIQGPVSIGERSVIRMGTRIYGGTTIGPVCKVSGEIQNVILYGHSNKAHDGYLGNSLIGEWCNLGANTTTSNLKNNYKPIRIPEWSTGHVHKTALQFFGTVMGDHGKTAINTTLSAGTLCGVFCNIFTYGFPPKKVPSFSWVSPHDTEPYQFEKAMETAEIMMKRRDVPLGRDYLLMMKHIFDNRDLKV
jgi:UDP-N-acetylglucosamine diphosphorylase/glucosamine-1-phosphate N-acetyltransferase